MTTPDPYEMLQLGPDATPEELRAAYERLSHRPDIDQEKLALAYQLAKPLPRQDGPEDWNPTVDGPLHAIQVHPADRGKNAAWMLVGGGVFLVGAALAVVHAGDWGMSWRLRGWLPDGMAYFVGASLVGGFVFYCGLVDAMTNPNELEDRRGRSPAERATDAAVKSALDGVFDRFFR